VLGGAGGAACRWCACVVKGDQVKGWGGGGGQKNMVRWWVRHRWVMSVFKLQTCMCRQPLWGMPVRAPADGT
jgi:hypothetical protein